MSIKSSCPFCSPLQASYSGCRRWFRAARAASSAATAGTWLRGRQEEEGCGMW